MKAISYEDESWRDRTNDEIYHDCCLELSQMHDLRQEMTSWVVTEETTWVSHSHVE